MASRVGQGVYLSCQLDQNSQISYSLLAYALRRATFFRDRVWQICLRVGPAIALTFPFGPQG